MGQYALFLLRVVAGFTFSAHGAQKLFGAFGGAHGGSTPQYLVLVAGVLEFFGGLLIILGLGTRPVAFLLCGEMAVAYFRTHLPRGFWPIQNGGELACLYCFIFLYLCAAGPGALSLDSMIWRKRSPRTKRR